jgi:hypothetical protein
MRFLLTLVCALTLTVGVAAAQGTYCYGWEDGGTVLGAWEPDNLYTANSTDQAYEGVASLEVYESANGSPQAYVAWITDLQEGDVVDASIWTLDNISGNPSLRIWGHYTDAGGTIDDYAGSAGGNGTYSGTSPDWIELTWSWTYPAGNDGGGLVIEIRPYNATPFAGSNWVDQLCVTIPDGASLQFPGGPVGAQGSSLSGVKALFR